jgi:tetratricopeptide (TPR) repeat protein
MSSAGKDEVQRSKSRMRMYFILSAILILIMALLSSLGDAFVYVFSGLAFFFAFLGWQNWRQAERDSDFQHYDRSGRNPSTSSFAEELRTIFRSKGKTENVKSPTADHGRRIIIIAATFIGGIFVLIMGIILATGTAENESESLDLQSDGDAQYTQGNYDSAYISYHRGITLNENFAEGYFGLGNIKYQQSDFDSALYYYDRTLQADPAKFDASYMKAWIYYERKDRVQSLKELNYILGRTDQYVDAWLLAGDNYYVNNQYDSAIVFYESGYSKGARKPELLNIMAYIYDVRGDQAKAIDFYRETLTYDSTLSEVHKRLGELLPGEEGNYYRTKASGQQW